MTKGGDGRHGVNRRLSLLRKRKMDTEQTASSLEPPPAPDMRTPQLFSCPAASSTDVEQIELAEYTILQHLHVKWQHALGNASTPPLLAPLASNSGPDTASVGPELLQGVSPAFMDVPPMQEICTAEEVVPEQWINKQIENLDHLKAQPPETWKSFLKQRKKKLLATLNI